MQVEEIKNELERFEALRGLLGHDIVVAVEPLFEGFDLDGRGTPELVEEVLARYARAVRQGLESWWEGWEPPLSTSVTQPVTPLVDLARLEVRHETCGASTYWLRPVGGRWLGYSNQHFEPTPGRVWGLRAGGFREEDAPEHGTLGWHAARALLGRTGWSGGGGSVALGLAETYLKEKGCDLGLIGRVVSEGFISSLAIDPSLPARIKAEAEAFAAEKARSHTGARPNRRRETPAESETTSVSPVEICAKGHAGCTGVEWECELLEQIKNEE